MGKKLPHKIKKDIKLILGNKCSKCGQLPEWYGQYLNLEIDHIDGNNENNLLLNLRVLCRHCHSLTNTFGSKNRGKVSKVENYSLVIDGIKHKVKQGYFSNNASHLNIKNIIKSGEISFEIKDSDIEILQIYQGEILLQTIIRFKNIKIIK